MWITREGTPNPSALCKCATISLQLLSWGLFRCFYVTKGFRTFFRSRYLTFAFSSKKYGRRHVNLNKKNPAQVRLHGAKQNGVFWEPASLYQNDNIFSEWYFPQSDQFVTRNCVKSTLSNWSKIWVLATSELK